jgi:hypothetical protein
MLSVYDMVSLILMHGTSRKSVNKRQTMVFCSAFPLQ